MDSGQMFEMVRPMIIVVDGIGIVQEARGGHGGFLGYSAAEFIGANVFDFVAPSDIDELAKYFVETVDESPDTVSLPVPFRVHMVGGDGVVHPVDVIPVAIEEGETAYGWVVTIVPLSMNTSMSRSLDAEMSGASRGEVRRALTEELVVDNANYTSRWFLIDFNDNDQLSVTTSRDDDQPLAELVKTEIVEQNWRPWIGLPDHQSDAATIARDELPTPIAQALTALDWRRCAVAPVRTGDEIVAAYLLFGRVPDDYPVDEIKSNVRARITALVDITSLLISRWNDRDQLLKAATSDLLTGLPNRRAMTSAIATAVDEQRRSAVLYIDVDEFKSINDSYGHDAGDQVLIEVSQRIKRQCRPGDVVSRFGGDEFVVLLEGASIADAAVIGERIVDAVGAQLIGVAGPDHVYVSVGIAPLEAGSNPLNSADRAMLEAKRSGRGRVVQAQQT